MLREVLSFDDSALEQKVSPADSFLPQANSILELGVDYFGIINQHGKLEAVIFKNDISLSKEKKDMLDLRIKSVEKQEKAIEEKAKKLQAEVMAELEKHMEKDGRTH